MSQSRGVKTVVRRGAAGPGEASGRRVQPIPRRRGATNLGIVTILEKRARPGRSGDGPDGVAWTHCDRRGDGRDGTNHVKPPAPVPIGPSGPSSNPRRRPAATDLEQPGSLVGDVLVSTPAALRVERRASPVSLPALPPLYTARDPDGPGRTDASCQTTRFTALPETVVVPASPPSLFARSNLISGRGRKRLIKEP